MKLRCQEQLEKDGKAAAGSQRSEGERGKVERKPSEQCKGEGQSQG